LKVRNLDPKVLKKKKEKPSKCQKRRKKKKKEKKKKKKEKKKKKKMKRICYKKFLLIYHQKKTNVGVFFSLETKLHVKAQEKNLWPTSGKGFAGPWQRSPKKALSP